MLAEAALVACREEEVSSWTTVVPVECSEVVKVETEMDSMVARTWTQVALVEEDKVALMGPLNLQWNRWKEEEVDVEDLEKWIKAGVVRDTEMNPTRHRGPVELC